MDSPEDPVAIAAVLLEKTNAILCRLETGAPRNGENELEDIHKDMETCRQLSSREMVVDKAGKSECWKEELLKKLSNLEQELNEIKESSAPSKTDLRIGTPSSKVSSPIKKSARKPIRRYQSSDELRLNLRETERIIDRGFKTARELNGKLELLRRQKKHRNVEVQVSPISLKSVDEPAVSSDNDSYIRGLAEDVTSLLVQQDVRKAAKNKRVNTRNLVIRSQDERRAEIPRGRRLVVQKLPDNHIRTPLTVQTLPSVNIAPDSAVAAPTADNTGVFFITHSTVPAKDRKNSIKITDNREIGVQAEFSEKSKSDKLEKLIANLGHRYRENNPIDGSREIKTLLKDVEATKHRLTAIARKTSTPVDNKPSKSPSDDEYKSDFEVESLVQDSQTKSSASAGSAPKNVTPPKISLSSKTNSISTDESLIEIQMKRLGLSTDRTVGQRVKTPLKSTEDENSLIYIKRNGKFVPVDHVDSPKVQIIVPEIVVRLPEAVNSNKQDRLIQTDEGFVTLTTSGDASSVVEQLNKRFERTELLLERIGGKSSPANDLLGLLKRREIGESPYLRMSADEDIYKKLPAQERLGHSSEAFNNAADFFNSCQSIGEISNSLRR